MNANITDLWAEIGKTAGEVYVNFVNKGEVKLSDAKKKVSKKELFEMAVGWLAREGKIQVLKQGNTMKIKILP
ncbi:MAG: winged helix-turn-helix domain-containing protein [Candidatus Altiarchaeota archaeon]